MSNTAEQIVTSAEGLPVDAQQAPLDTANSLSSSQRAFDALGEIQRAELVQSIVEVNAGVAMSETEFDRELDALLSAMA